MKDRLLKELPWVGHADIFAPEMKLASKISILSIQGE